MRANSEIQGPMLLLLCAVSDGVMRMRGGLRLLSCRQHQHFGSREEKNRGEQIEKADGKVLLLPNDAVHSVSNRKKVPKCEIARRQRQSPERK
jgi:hypothetical protein